MGFAIDSVALKKCLKVLCGIPGYATSIAPAYLPVPFYLF
jgi:hypothetical protein